MWLTAKWDIYSKVGDGDDDGGRDRLQQNQNV